MRTAVKRGLSWLAAVAILISAMAVTNLFVLTDDSLSVWADTTSAQAADYNYKISAENAEVASGHVAAGTSASGYYALRGADGKTVGNDSHLGICRHRALCGRSRHHSSCRTPRQRTRSSLGLVPAVDPGRPCAGSDFGMAQNEE